MSFTQKDLVKKYRRKVVKPPASVPEQTLESIQAEYECKLEWLNLLSPDHTVAKIGDRSSVDCYIFGFEQLFPGLLDYMRENCLKKVSCDKKWHILLTAMDFLSIRLPEGIQWRKLIKGELINSFKFLKWFKQFLDIRDKFILSLSISTKTLVLRMILAMKT